MSILYPHQATSTRRVIDFLDMDTPLGEHYFDTQAEADTYINSNLAQAELIGAHFETYPIVPELDMYPTQQEQKQ